METCGADAVYRLADRLALVHTVDPFTPLADSPVIGWAIATPELVGFEQRRLDALDAAVGPRISSSGGNSGSGCPEGRAPHPPRARLPRGAS